MISINDINLNEYIHYGKVLTEFEIIRIGKNLKDFNKGRTTYIQFKDELFKMGVTAVAVLRDPAPIKLASKAEEFKERVKTNTIIGEDVHMFILSSDRYKNASISYDRFMIEALAKNGDEEAIETLTSLQDWERRHTPHNITNRKR